jgi:hypothetical protein
MHPSEHTPLLIELALQSQRTFSANLTIVSDLINRKNTDY